MAKRAGTRKNRKAGNRKTRKMSPKMRAWNEKVMTAFRAGRKRNPNYKLGEAMRDAKKM
jgi:hypothetical protein